MRLTEATDLLEHLLAEGRLKSLKALRKDVVRTARAPSAMLLRVLKAKIEKDSAAKSLKLLGADPWMEGQLAFYHADPSKDTYLHITTRDNAKKILAEGELKTAGPEYSSFVISMTYGAKKPGVQRGKVCGLKDAKECDVVGIVFKSDKTPKVGFPDETVFKGGTKIKNARMVDGAAFDALYDSLSRNTLPDNLDFYVLYTSADVEDYRKSAAKYGK
jgi:hypothetical protein